MSDQQPLPNGIVEEDPGLVMNALLLAVRRAAEDSAGAKDPREVRELAQGALAFAQAFVVLDPTRLQGGDTAQARVDATPTPPGVRDTDRDGKIGEQ